MVVVCDDTPGVALAITGRYLLISTDFRPLAPDLPTKLRDELVTGHPAVAN